MLEKRLRNRKLEHLVPRARPLLTEFMPSTDIPDTEADAFATIDSMLTEEERRMIATIPRTEESGAKYRDICVWVRNNWIYSPDGESDDLRKRRAACYQMMSAGEYTYDFKWSLSDAEVVSYIFMDRYCEHVGLL